jgi:MoaA/NifB/PqqE/SkfB family radical SAM enzyme
MPSPMSARASIDRLQIAVSYHCNLRCEHCYVPELYRTEYGELLESDELSVEEITGFVDHLVDRYGLRRVSVTGGEALLNKVWPRTRAVVEHALARGLEVQLNTSGAGQVPIEQVAAVVAGSTEQLLLHVSLDGVDEQKVNAFRGHGHAMQWALRTIREAVARGLRVQLRYTVTEANLDDTVPCYDLASELGVDEFAVKPMFAAGTARENQDQLIDTTDRVRLLQEALLDASVGARRTRLVLPEPVYVDPAAIPAEANFRRIECICGVESLYLSTNGDLMPCSYIVGTGEDLALTMGNIRDADFDFDAAWLDSTVWSEFQDAPRAANCTAQNVAQRALRDDAAESVVVLTSRRSGAASGSDHG